MSKPRFRAVAFDLDGLIFDTEALFARVIREMLAARGRPPMPEILQAIIGRRAAEAADTFRRVSGIDESTETLMAEARARFDAEVDAAVHPTPGLFALLERLASFGIPRAVATSSRRTYAAGLLSRHGLLDRFAFVLSAEDVSVGKPDPEIYLKAAARFGVPPVALVVLEDSPPGVSAGKAAGAFTVGVPHEHSPGAGLAHADLVVSRLDAPAFLDLLHPLTSRERVLDGRA